MKHIFVINPAAGKGKHIPALLSSITYACEETESDFAIYHTATVGDGIRYVSQMCQKYPDKRLRFYACGGDGTLYEVLNGVVGHENAEITVIPMGTGNDFIKTFTNPEYFADVKRQLFGAAEKIDVLQYGDRYAMNVVNLGFDCDVVQRVSEIKRSAAVPRKMAYTAAIADVFTKPYGKEFKVLIDGEEFAEREFMLCAMANAQYYGDGYRVAPHALLNDGLMDLCLVDCVSRAKFVRLISKYKAGDHVDVEDRSLYPFLHFQKCESVVIESKHTMGICGDGEISPVKTVEIRCIPKAISFSIPKGSFCTALKRETKSVNV